ncbi:MAG: F0F1 ATP synthase subunit B [Spirochaetia bacterium]|nr:F0F1 ATP synthase subunit B [Spirochaetia bacterium]
MPILSGGSLDLLHVNPGLVIWTVVTFLVVLAVLWRFAWKPIIKGLDARNERVEEDLQTSRDLREEAEKLLSEYEKKLDAAKTEALQLIDEGKKDAETNRNKILAEAQDEAVKIKERTEKDIERAKLKALDELEKTTVNLVVEILSKILKKDISEKEHKDIIIRELENLKQIKA